MKTNPKLEKLKSLRESKSISVREMSSLLGISKSMYSYIENGDKRLSYDMAVKIAAVFKMTPDELFENDFKEYFESTHI